MLQCLLLIACDNQGEELRATLKMLLLTMRISGGGYFIPESNVKMRKSYFVIATTCHPYDMMPWSLKIRRLTRKSNLGYMRKTFGERGKGFFRAIILCKNSSASVIRVRVSIRLVPTKPISHFLRSQKPQNGFAE